MYNIWVENRGTETRERNEKYNREKRKCMLECSLTHYNHERRFRRFKRNLHRIHNHLIPRNLGLDLRLIVGNRNRPYAANELIHKKPQQWLLTNKAKKIKCKYHRFLGKFKTIYSSSNHILNFNFRST